MLERSNRVAVVPAKFPWSDVGSWDALAELSSPDARGNVLTGDVLAVDAKHCFVETDGRLVALVGTEGLLVVARKDAVLVAAKGRSQDVKKIVDALERDGRRELL